MQAFPAVTPAEVCKPLASTQDFAPQAAQTALLAPRYARFQALYPALRELF